MKRRFPYWFEGAVFMAFIIPLIFFLKVTCPLETGCLADPFVVAAFSPLLILSFLSLDNLNSIWIEASLIYIFWILVGAYFRYLVGRIKTSGEVKRSLSPGFIKESDLEEED